MSNQEYIDSLERSAKPIVAGSEYDPYKEVAK